MVRRMLPAVMASVLLATGTTSFANQLIQQVVEAVAGPRGHEAVAWLRVRSDRGTGPGTAEYETFRRTQVQLITSPEILRAALDRPEIARLDALRDVGDKVDWLTRHVAVESLPESEVVTIRLRGDDPREAALIVDAVATAYADTVNKQEHAERLERRDALEKKYKASMAEVRTRLETFKELARSLGRRDSAEVASERSRLLDHLGTLRAQLTQLQRDVAAIDMELHLIEATRSREPAGDSDAADDAVDAALLRHPRMVELAKRMAELDERIAFQAERSSRGADDPAVKRLQAQREELQHRIDELAAELRPQVVVEIAGDPARRPGAVEASPVVLRMRRDILVQRLEDTSKEFDKVAKDVVELGDASAELQAQRDEIAQLQAVTNQLGIELEAAQVDMAMANRVEIMSLASDPRSAEKAQGVRERSGGRPR